MLWLCLHFDQLALDVFPASDAATVVVDASQVLAANAAAQAAGIDARCGLAAALALAPGLVVHEQQPARARDLLETLACWAEAFTPTVSIAGADALLLEIGGCLRLFGGLARLRAGVAADLQAQGVQARQGVAPTPLAAHWLACAHDEEACPSLAELPARLARLPLAVMHELEAARRRSLESLGVRHLGDLFALPEAGLRRRFGGAFVEQLARARGERPDPRAAFVFPERFALQLELPAKVSEAAMLMFAARRLLAALASWLAVRASGLSRCGFVFEHEERPQPTRLELGFAEPTADLQRFQRVLQERLAHLQLAEPVWRMRLEAEQVRPLAGREQGLFGQDAAQALAPVIERLRARLGEEAVQALEVVADHRPECATRGVRETQRAARPPARLAGARPLWLLAMPQALSEREGVPQHGGGDLLRVAGPERIESGWWSESVGDVRRDYFVACTPRGEWLWVFRDAQGWWLHGYFA